MKKYASKTTSTSSCCTVEEQVSSALLKVGKEQMGLPEALVSRAFMMVTCRPAVWKRHSLRHCEVQAASEPKLRQQASARSVLIASSTVYSFSNLMVTPA